MAVDGVGGSRQAEQLQQERRSAESQKTGNFQAMMKGERAKGDAKAGSKDKSDKSEKSEKSEKEPKGMLDTLLGHHDRMAGEALHGRLGGEGGGKGGEGGGEGGEGEGKSAEGVAGKGKAGEAEGDGKAAGKGGAAFGEKLRGKLDGKGAAEKSAKAEAGAKAGKGLAGGKGEGAAKAGKGEGGEKAEGASAKEGADAKGLAAKEAAKQDQAKAADAARRADAKAGDKDSASKPDDGKTMQEQIAKNMFPGEVPHPFLMQQVDAATQVQATQVVIPPEIIDKVVAQARFGTNAAGASEFQIQLKDDVFKGAELKIATKDGKVSVELVAKDAESAATFEQQAQQIAKQLTDKGLKVENVTVSIAQQGGGNQDASQGQSKGRDQQQQGRGVGGVGGAKGAAQRAGADSASGLDSGRRSGKDYSA